MRVAPFAQNQGVPFIDSVPFLGGFLRLLPAAVAAITDVTLTHPLRVVPRVVLVLSAGTTFCAKTKVGSLAWTTSAVTVQFDIAQPAGAVLWIW